jgi:salicylate hydroxylase
MAALRMACLQCAPIHFEGVARKPLRGATTADVAQALTRYQTLRRDRTARVQRYARINGFREHSALEVSLAHPWVLNHDVEQAALDLSRRSM